MKTSNGLKSASNLEWQVSDQICALSDGERHIGHAVRVGGRWQAFDAMHSDPSGTGFLSLGTFIAMESAKHAVEQCYCMARLPLAGAA